MKERQERIESPVFSLEEFRKANLQPELWPIEADGCYGKVLDWRLDIKQLYDDLATRREEEEYYKGYELSNYQRYIEHVYVYLYFPRLSDDQLAGLIKSGQEINAADLIRAQHSVLYIGQVARVMKQTWQNKSSLKVSFPMKESPPDLTQGFKTTAIDKNGNILFALQLSLGKVVGQELFESINRFKQLEEIADSEGLKIDPSALMNGFVDLVTANRINELLQSGILNEDQLELFYQTVSDWLAEITEDVYSSFHEQTNRRRKNTTRIYPFPTEIDTNYPDIRFLPYIASAYVKFIMNVPRLVKNGEYYGHNELEEAEKNMFIFADKVLMNFLANQLGVKEEMSGKEDLKYLYSQVREKYPEVAELANAIYKKVHSYQEIFNLISEYFREHPGILNRKNSITSSSDIESFNDYRQRILDAGGRIPKKPSKFRFENAVKKSQI